MISGSRPASPGQRLVHGPVVLRVVRAGRHQGGEQHEPAPDPRLERVPARAVAADDARPDPGGREHAAVELRHRRAAARAPERQPAPRVGMDVVGMRERQGQRLPPPFGHPLVEPGERGRGRRVAAHHVDDVDEVRLAEEREGSRVGVGPEGARPEQLAPRLDDDRLPVRQPRERPPVAHDVDHAVAEPHRERLELVQRPLVGLVVLARRRQHRQLGQPAPHRGLEAQAGARAVQPEGPPPRWARRPGSPPRRRTPRGGPGRAPRGRSAAGGSATRD